MISNPIVDAMLRRKSIREYTADSPSDEVIETVVRAGQQAPFAYQLCSLLLSRDRKHIPFRAPLLFTICVDVHRHERMMAGRGWQIVSNDLSLLLFGLQDAAYVAENMVMAAESLGMGSCFLGGAPYHAAKIARAYKLPPRVFPLVQLTMGYPAENPPPRPRYPIEFTLHEGEYHEADDELLERSMAEMDQGYLAQDYYRKLNAIIPLENGRPETFTFDNYSWTEHISRKAGQWEASAAPLLAQLAHCGFHIGQSSAEAADE